MRVVMVSKALAVGAYQRKLEEIARLPGVELTAIVPSEWRDRRGRVTLERARCHGLRVDRRAAAVQRPVSSALLSHPRPPAATTAPRHPAHGRRAVQPGDVARAAFGSSGRRGQPILHLAEPESALSLALPRVRNCQLSPRGVCDCRQSRRGRCPAHQGLSRSDGGDPAVWGGYGNFPATDDRRQTTDFHGQISHRRSSVVGHRSSSPTPAR